MTTAHHSETKHPNDVLYHQAFTNLSGFRDIDALHVASVVGKVRLIDVREPKELVDELGHVAGVENVPLATLEHASRAWDKQQELVLICRSGGRSGRAAAYLASIGFARVMNMVGGMLAWNAAQLPIER